MKKHHITLFVVAGIIVVLLATSLTVNAPDERKGYVVSELPSPDAIACCDVEEKTCYALDGNCEHCMALCG